MLRRQHSDLIWCFNIVFGYVDVHRDDYFEFRRESATRGRFQVGYKTLYC